MAPYHHHRRRCQRHEVGCVCVSISSKHHQAELPNFSVHIRYFFSLRFYRHGIFRMVLRRENRDGNVERLLCLMQAAATEFEQTVLFLCLSHSAIAFFFATTHLHISSQPRDVLQVGLCVRRNCYIASSQHMHNHQPSRQSSTYRMSHSRFRENVVQKEDENRRFGCMKG